MVCYVFQSCFNWRADDCENFLVSLQSLYHSLNHCIWPWLRAIPTAECPRPPASHPASACTSLTLLPLPDVRRLSQGAWDGEGLIRPARKNQGCSLIFACSPFSVQLQGNGAGAAAPWPTRSTLWAQRLLEKGAWTHFTSYTVQHHGQPSPLFSLCQLRLTHGQTPHLCVPLWRIKGNYQFLLPLKAYISLLSLTASDNEGQFKNHIKIQQPHTHTRSAI